jgi:tetratricopeptide (TPR) repeat protein
MTTEPGGAEIQGDLVSGNKIVHMRPAADVEPPPRQLPPDIPGFTGRQDVLTDLDRLVENQGTTPVIIALSGMPGIGKTALAVHWAHMMAERFPDGQLFIDLRGYSVRGALPPRAALQQALRTLRVPVSRLPVDEDELAALFRSRLANNRVLLLLDDARDAQQVYSMLPGTPSCVVVVTARRKLAGLVARYGAQARALDLLPAAEALDLIGEVAGPERMRREPNAAAELVRICARLPLALRVAAADLATRPQQTVADTVEALSDGDRLSKLALGEDPREAVGAAFDLSYRNLDSETRRMFRLLGLLEGPNVTPEAVGALLGATPQAAQRLLEQLETAGLVQWIGRGRYRLHELMREYARGRALDEDSIAVRDTAVQRLSTWYLATAQQAGRFLDRYRRTIRQELTAPPVNPDPAERARHLEWFALEQPNLSEIIRQVARLGWDQLTWELADAVYDFYELRRYCDENLEAHRLGLEAAERASNTLVCFFMHHHLSVTYRELGQAQESLTEAETALQLSTRIGDRYGEAAVLDDMARTHVQLSDYRTALKLGERSLKIREEISDPHGEASALDTLARGHQGLSEYREGYKCAKSALEIHKKIGDWRGEAETLDCMARIYYARGRLTTSLESAAQALRIRKEIGDRHGEGETLAFLGLLNMRIGHHRQAREHAERALALRRQINDRQGEAQALVYLSTIRRRLGLHEDAIQAGLEALDIVQELGDRHHEAEALESLSRCYRRLGWYDAARRDATRALVIRREIGDRYGEANTLNALSLIDMHTGRLRRARAITKRSLKVSRLISDRRGIANGLDLLSKIYLRMERTEKALSTASRSLAIDLEIDDQYGQAVTRRALANILWRLGRLPEAIVTAQAARSTAMQIGDERSVVETLQLQAAIYWATGRPSMALAAEEEAHTMAARLEGTS